MKILFSNSRGPQGVLPPGAGPETKRPQNGAGHALRCAGRGGDASSAPAAVGDVFRVRARRMFHLPGRLLVCALGLAAALLGWERWEEWCRDRLG